MALSMRAIELLGTQVAPARDTVALRLRIFSRQEAAYLRHGGILPYVVRRAVADG
ncbi:hypothetical protein AB0P17_33015 [Streptomyces sp. NPDC088124]|uniref:hypothetical protein n=1 Tax=Streptomyces sp. NPDC088124 TaxID=3154654 RepID=UPI003447EE0C